MPAFPLIRLPAKIAAGLATALTLAIMAALPHQASAAGCAGADVSSNETSGSELRSATLCLLNRERRGRGLRGLRHNRLLALAATRHARDMVERRYFSHDSPGGRDFVDRLRLTGYVSSSTPYAVGENLAWGTGGLSTPRSIVRSWMKSPGHRANILNRRFREVGIGIALGAPVSGHGSGATYASEFGSRR